MENNKAGDKQTKIVNRKILKYANNKTEHNKTNNKRTIRRTNNIMDK